MRWPWQRPDLRFVPHFGRPDIGTPVVPARAVRAAWLKPQYDAPPVKFARCPGMWDHLQAGYIIPAWCDIHIKANSQGVIVRMEGSNHDGQHEASTMDFALVDGLAKIDATAKRCVIKIPTPWAVFSKPGVSCQVLPALMHSDFLDKMHIYPGEVSYDKFSTLNLIMSITTACEFTIWAGEPLLQVIPFERRDFRAECGPATPRELAQHRHGFFSKRPGFYRKMFHGVKKYLMTMDTST